MYVDAPLSRWTNLYVNLSLLLCVAFVCMYVSHPPYRLDVLVLPSRVPSCLPPVRGEGNHLLDHIRLYLRLLCYWDHSIPMFLGYGVALRVV